MLTRLVAICVIAFGFGFFGSMPLAGPIAVMVASRAAQKKFDEALRVSLGAAAAEGIYAALAFCGFAAFLARHAFVKPLSHAATAVVLLALGVRFAFWQGGSGDSSRRDENKAGTAFVGFSVSALNPTLLLTWSAVVAFLYSKGIGGHALIYAVPFGLSAALGIAAWFALGVGLLRRYGRALPRAALTWTVRAMGLTLVALGLWSGVQLAKWLGGDRDPPAFTPSALAAPVCSPACNRAPSSTPTSPSKRPSTSCFGIALPDRRAACSLICSIC